MMTNSLLRLGYDSKRFLRTRPPKKEVGDLEIAQKGKLEQDPAYLIWLLEKAQAKELNVSKDIKELLVTQIEELTGQTHGANLKQWQIWVSKANESETQPPQPTITDRELLAHKGTLEKVSGHIGKLIRLKLFA